MAAAEGAQGADWTAADFVQGSDWWEHAVCLKGSRGTLKDLLIGKKKVTRGLAHVFDLIRRKE